MDKADCPISFILYCLRGVRVSVHIFKQLFYVGHQKQGDTAIFTKVGTSTVRTWGKICIWVGECVLRAFAGQAYGIWWGSLHELGGFSSLFSFFFFSLFSYSVYVVCYLVDRRGCTFVEVSLLLCHSGMVVVSFVCWMVIVFFFVCFFTLGCRSYWVYTLLDIATIVSLTRALGIWSK
jgi:hypothetical protein